VKRLVGLARNPQPPTERVADLLLNRSTWQMNERNRVIVALDAHGWRRRDTKFQIFDEEPETGRCSVLARRGRRTPG
jgi:hypothetical protein